ncbi:hypothetical protein [Paenibacillus tarimensis]|uniref:hypothetical protein n=1 Tax=Paenibacillus tarimensis TaxID=416012 RepID=UPI001F3E9B53|nr:hypothetical protein [Paenibacillus tarimensis]MCF2945746.1 hypothetical protein [Paenibacillus tarimensis]
MGKGRFKENINLLVVLAGIILILIAVLVFSVYSLQVFDFIKIRITSIGSLVAFIALLFLGLGILGIIGTFLSTLRKHLFKDRFKLAVITVQEIVLIAIFGVIIYTIDLWIDGVVIENVQTEILLALFLYGLISLIGKMGEQIKKQDEAKKEKDL